MKYSCTELDSSYAGHKSGSG